MNAYVIDYSFEQIAWHFQLKLDEVIDTLIDACMSGELGTLYNDINEL